MLQVTWMRRSPVLSRPLQLRFPAEYNEITSGIEIALSRRKDPIEQHVLDTNVEKQLSYTATDV